MADEATTETKQKMKVAQLRDALKDIGFGKDTDDQFETGEAWEAFGQKAKLSKSDIARVKIDIQAPCDDELEFKSEDIAFNAIDTFAVKPVVDTGAASSARCEVDKPQCGEILPEEARDVDGAIAAQSFSKLSRLKMNLGTNNKGHVEELQEKLKECGIYQGTVDGSYGHGTQRAVIDAQLRMSRMKDENGQPYYSGAIDGVWGKGAEGALERLGQDGKTLCGEGCPTPSASEIDKFQARAYANESAHFSSRRQVSGHYGRRSYSHCNDYIAASNFGAGVGGVGQVVGYWNPVGFAITGGGTAITGFSNMAAALDGCPNVPYAQAHIGVFSGRVKVRKDVYHHRDHPTPDKDGRPGRGTPHCSSGSCGGLPTPITPGGLPGMGTPHSF